MKPFLGFDDEGRPICPTRAARREEITRIMRRQRQAQFVPGDDPAELTPVRSALAEGRAALIEMGVAVACAAPVSLVVTVYLWMHL